MMVYSDAEFAMVYVLIRSASLRTDLKSAHCLIDVLRIGETWIGQAVLLCPAACPAFEREETSMFTISVR